MRSTDDCVGDRVVEERLLELLLELLRVELPVAEAFRPDVLLAELFFAALTLRPADLLAPREVLVPLAFLVRLAVRGAFLLPERVAELDLVAAPLLRGAAFAVLLFRALVFAPAFVPLFRAAVFVPLVLLAPVREVDFRAPEVGLAALRAAPFRRGDALDELDLEDDVDDDGDRLEVLPVREPALRLELLGDDFFAAML
ncbi:MAG: hypothetical protein ACR2MQ_03570 [Gemmatimonadaceae bacterium]